MSTWYVDALATSGDTSGNGSETYPWQTISKAVASAASGDTIVVAAGVYRETITVAQMSLVFYGRGMVVVDGETLRRCIVVSFVPVSYTAPTIVFQNFIFRNGSDCIGYLGSIYSVTYPYGGAAPVFVNCCFYQDSLTPLVPLWWAASTMPTSLAIGISLFNCTIKRLSTVVYASVYFYSSTYGPVGVGIQAYDTIFDVQNAASQMYCVVACSGASLSTNPEGALTDFTHSWPYGTAGSLDLRYMANNAGKGTVNAYHTVDITATPPPYTTDSYPDPVLYLNRAGSYIGSYLGGGRLKNNIGSEWYPVYGWNANVAQSATALVLMPAWRDPVSAVESVTDPNYVDGVTKGPAVRVNDSNGDHWEIDTMTQPGATSCRVVGAVVKIPVRTGSPVTIKAAIRQCVEDLTLAAGSRKVMDSTILDATRTECYRASVTPFGQTAASGGAVPAWVDVNFTSDYTETFTQTFYLQLGFVLTTVGQ